MASQARIDANRRNAEKSTGPNTPEGKERSRRNALKHGLCARVVDIPGEDGDEAAERLAQRLRAWSGQLNPHAWPVDAYLVDVAVRESGRLDRCHRATEYRLARRARDAEAEWTDRRMLDVEALVLELLEGEQPHTAARKLAETPQGCDYLIAELEQLTMPMFPDPPLWDDVDGRRLYALLGMVAPAHGKSPDPTGLCARAIRDYREVADKLRDNERPDAIDWTRAYASRADHEYDLARLAELRSRGLAARDEILWTIRKRVGELAAIRAGLAARDDLDRSEARHRAQFDPSPEGLLLRRYESEAVSGLHRSLKGLRELARERRLGEGPSPGPVASQPFAPQPASPPPAPARPRPAPNEAKGGPAPARDWLLDLQADPDPSYVNIAMVPKGRLKRRR